MSKDTCIKANTYCPVHKGIVGADCWHDSKDFSVPRTDWKQVDEINTLREQVKKLENRLNKDSQEFTILCAKETEKVLREQLAAALAACEAKDAVLNGIKLYRAFNGDDWPSREAITALAIKPDASALQKHDIEVFRKGAEYAFKTTGGNEGLSVSDEEAIRELKGEI